MNTNTFRVVLTGLCTVVNSNAATLYVNPLPTITLSAALYSSLIPGQQTTLTANVNPPGGNFTWFWNSSVLPGVNGSTITPVTVEGIGTYRAVYTDPNGCVITSNDYLMNGTPSENLWVYPNPNKGFFEARYYNQTGEPATIMVFNAAGQLIYQRAFTTRLTYSSIVVDLTTRSYTAGVYIVKVVNSSGRELAAKKVVVYH
ncbi:MAG: T9SS type A sorting domain-containing protein, partial [Chitinophagaceae bacterium]|nr:T9SS type A sorting domain-containing protein [Chitinophagaceae bacterium]